MIASPNGVHTVLTAYPELLREKTPDHYGNRTYGPVLGGPPMKTRPKSFSCNFISLYSAERLLL